tara:strand:+ start:1917 stop:2303 length:387 start_codon:yes stop_codon:yes gene_type:complete
MKNYRNNLRRNRYRSGGERNYIRNGNGQKLSNDFSNSSNFRRRNPGKNNQNASKLIEKYTTLAKEALSNGDKILSENYLQHADHFIRVMGDKLKEKNININNGLENKEINSDSNSLKETESETKTETI